MSSSERINIITKILAHEGSKNIYQLRKMLSEELGTKIDYRSVYRYVKFMERKGIAEFIRGKRRKAKEYYLTDNGLTEARNRGYINFEQWVGRSIDYAHLHAQKHVDKLFKLAKKSRIISALLSLSTHKDAKNLELISSIFNIAVWTWELERSYDAFLGEEKRSQYYTQRLNRITVSEIFTKVFPTLTQEDKAKFASLLTDEDFNLLDDIIKEQMKTNKEMTETFKQAYEKSETIREELKKLYESRTRTF